MPVKPHSRRGLTPLQRKVVFVGCNETARYLGESPLEYRRKIMLEELKIISLTECNRTDDFDKLMRRIWVDRGDYARALDYTGGDVKRLRYLAIEAAKKILVQADGEGTCPDYDRAALRYVAAVMVQMHMSTQTVDSLVFQLARPDGFDDFSPIALKKVVSALQVHLRRKT